MCNVIQLPVQHTHGQTCTAHTHAVVNAFEQQHMLCGERSAKAIRQLWHSALLCCPHCLQLPALYAVAKHSLLCGFHKPPSAANTTNKTPRTGKVWEMPTKQLTADSPAGWDRRRRQ